MSLRQAMPITAAFIDDLRAVFGADEINTAIKKGHAGLPGHFHATEAGHEAGTPFPAGHGWVKLTDMDVATPAPPVRKDGRK